MLCIYGAIVRLTTYNAANLVICMYKSNVSYAEAARVFCVKEVQLTAFGYVLICSSVRIGDERNSCLDLSGLLYGYASSIV